MCYSLFENTDGRELEVEYTSIITIIHEWDKYNQRFYGNRMLMSPIKRQKKEIADKF